MCKSQREHYVLDASLFQCWLFTSMLSEMPPTVTFKTHLSASTLSSLVTTTLSHSIHGTGYLQENWFDFGLATTHNKLSHRKSFFDSLNKTCYLWVELPRELFELPRDLFDLLRDWYSRPEVGSGGRAGPQN